MVCTESSKIVPFNILSFICTRSESSVRKTIGPWAWSRPCLLHHLISSEISSLDHLLDLFHCFSSGLITQLCQSQILDCLHPGFQQQQKQKAGVASFALQYCFCKTQAFYLSYLFIYILKVGMRQLWMVCVSNVWSYVNKAALLDTLFQLNVATDFQ